MFFSLAAGAIHSWHNLNLCLDPANSPDGVYTKQGLVFRGQEVVAIKGEGRKTSKKKIDLNSDKVRFRRYGPWLYEQLWLGEFPLESPVY